jgi:predicted nucleotidyltransferase
MIGMMAGSIEETNPIWKPNLAVERLSIEEQQQIEERFKLSWQVAWQAARCLRTEFGAKRIAVFGTLVNRDWYHLWSDIDLAVWGIPAERYYKSIAAVTGLSSDFKIDLVDPEACSASLRACIEREGVEL